MVEGGSSSGAMFGQPFFSDCFLLRTRTVQSSDPGFISGPFSAPAALCQKLIPLPSSMWYRETQREREREKERRAKSTTTLTSNKILTKLKPVHCARDSLVPGRYNGRPVEACRRSGSRCCLPSSRNIYDHADYAE